MTRSAAGAVPLAVVAWSPTWRVDAARVAQAVLRAGAGVVRRVGHVGATAVTGLAAVPTVDVVGLVDDPDDAAGRLAPTLADGGFVALPTTASVLAGTRRFVLPASDAPGWRAHLLLVADGSTVVADLLRFRDRLRADPPLGDAYTALRRELLARDPYDRDAYERAHGPFVARVLAADGPLVLGGGAMADPVVVEHPVHGRVVARRPGPWTPSVRRLLEHLAARGFPAPRPVGVDRYGRELVTWVPGTTHRLPATPTEAGAVGGLLRAYHDAVRDLPDHPDDAWAGDRRTRRPGQVIGHGDLSWGNVAWDGGVPVGLVDLDLAEPRWPVEDLAELAWQLVPLGSGWHAGMPAEHDDLDGRRARLAALCAGYGDPRLTPVAVLDALGARLREEQRRLRDLADAHPYDLFAARGDAHRLGAAQRWLAAHRRAVVG